MVATVAQHCADARRNEIRCREFSVSSPGRALTRGLELFYGFQSLSLGPVHLFV